MHPDLPARNLPPAGWRTHHFTNPKTGHTIFYGSVFPQEGTPPMAVVVCLGGLSEFSEKYYELAHDMLGRNYAFWYMDWAYQGRSNRFASNPHKRHSDGFDADISDLYKFVTDYVKPAAVHPDKGRIPLILIAHSMGANIGLRFLQEHPHFFEGAAFSAPFLGIYNFGFTLKIVALLLRPFLPLIKTCYVFGGSDWKPSMRKSDGTDVFSSDPVRDKIHNTWCLHDPALQVGSVTFQWLYAALASCKKILSAEYLSSIKIPVLLAMAEKDQIVDNHAIETASGRMQTSTLLTLNDAKHEILMENDAIRGGFLNAFDKMVKENKIATLEKLKKF